MKRARSPVKPKIMSASYNTGVFGTVDATSMQAGCAKSVAKETKRGETMEAGAQAGESDLLVDTLKEIERLCQQADKLKSQTPVDFDTLFTRFDADNSGYL